MRGMRTYALELELASPIHVGMGADHNWPAYAYLPDARTGEVVLLDPARLVAELAPDRREALLRAVAEGPARAQRLLRNWFREGVPLPETGRILGSPAFFKAVEDASDRAELEFRPMPRNLKGPYLPGSSVKGALRTAWIYAKLEPRLEQNDLVYDRREGWQPRPKRGNDGVLRPGRGDLRAAQWLEAYALDYLGRKGPDMYKDPFRTVRLGDGPVPLQTRLEHVAVVHPEDRLKDVSILAEVIPEGTRVRLPFRYHQEMARQGVVAGPVEPEALADAAYAFYLGVLEEELSYAEENGWKRAADVYRALLQTFKSATDAFPLRLGFGSGKLANTLLFLMEAPTPKTRKSAGSTNPRLGLPLGWARARLIAP